MPPLRQRPPPACRCSRFYSPFVFYLFYTGERTPSYAVAKKSAHFFSNSLHVSGKAPERAVSSALDASPVRPPSRRYSGSTISANVPVMLQRSPPAPGSAPPVQATSPAKPRPPLPADHKGALVSTRYIQTPRAVLTRFRHTDPRFLKKASQGVRSNPLACPHESEYTQCAVPRPIDDDPRFLTLMSCAASLVGILPH